MLKDPIAFLTRSVRQYGDVIILRPPTGKVYIVNNADYVGEVLLTQFNNFGRSKLYKLFKELLGNSIILNDGDTWLQQRRMLQPAFHRERIAGYGKIMVDYTNRLSKEWHKDLESHPEKSFQVDMEEKMFKFTLQTGAATLFGVDTSNEADDIAKAFEEALDVIQTRINSIWQWPAYVPTPGNIRYQKARTELDQTIYGIINEIRAKKSEQKAAGITGTVAKSIITANGNVKKLPIGGTDDNLLAMLLDIQDEDGQRMTDKQMRDQIMNLFLGSHDTNATTLTWLWYLLAQHPEVEAKLIQELQEVLGTPDGKGYRSPTVEDFPRLHYTEMVVKETLRMYPASWLIPRLVVKTAEIGGYTIPEGNELWISTWAMHHDPRYFPEPEKFSPERWADAEFLKNLPRFAYIPFGGGPRQCIGNGFSMTQITLVTAALATQFHFELADPTPVNPVFRITIRPPHGLQMRVSARSKTTNSSENERNTEPELALI
jgi:cytochrome P450